MNEKSLENLKKRKTFSKDYQPEHNGRPKNMFKHLHNQYECSAEDVDAVMKELFNVNITELKNIIKDPSTATLRRIIASALLKDDKKGSIAAIQFLLERQFGKAKQTIDASLTTNIIYADKQDKDL